MGLGALEVGLPNVNHVSEGHSHGQAPEWSAFVYVNVYTCVYMCANTRSMKPTSAICSPKEVGRGRGKLGSASLREMGGISKASYGSGEATGHGSPHTQAYGVWQGDQKALGLLSPTVAMSCTFRAARASGNLGRFAGTSASACCSPGSSCSSVSSKG